MSVSMLSPLKSEVFSSFDSLSPPPTPIAKRSRHFFPSNAATPPTPTFFPVNQSILGSSYREEHHPSTSPSANHEKEGADDADNKQLTLLASQPAPNLRLKPRSRTNVSQARVRLEQLQIDQFPPLPFSFPDESFKPIEYMTAQMSFTLDASDSNNSDSVSMPKSILIKPAPARNSSQQAKLPSFQRGGMKHEAAKKRNSFAARSA